MMLLLQLALSGLQVIILAGLIYYYFLLAGGTLNRNGSNPSLTNGKNSRCQFAILIPAHNEAMVIGQTVTTLTKQDYPADLFDIYVVADHCQDKTAQIATDAGAICFDRNEKPRGRKAYPLQWLLQRVLAGEKEYHAVVIFDADSQVAPDFLSAMAASLAQGYKALQGQHVISNPQDAVFSQLAAIDMRLNNLLRNQAKHNLQLSCRLMGDAMCFEVALIRAIGWGGESLIEDREFEIHLLLAGEKVRYASDAISYGQATSRWGDATKQRMRWYSGVMQLQRTYLLPLLHSYVRTLRPAVLDRALELLLPSYSWLAVLTFVLLLTQVIWPGLSLLVSWRVMLLVALGWVLFPVIALWAARAPAWCYRAMVYAPVYLLWRIGQSLLLMAQRGRVDWIRTRRREESA